MLVPDVAVAAVHSVTRRLRRTARFRRRSSMADQTKLIRQCAILESAECRFSQCQAMGVRFSGSQALKAYQQPSWSLMPRR